MAIARVWQSGAETGSILEMTTAVGAATLSVATKYTGAYSFQVGSTTFTTLGYITQSIPNTKQCRIGAYEYGQSFSGVGHIFDVRHAGGELVSLRTQSNVLQLYVAGTLRDSISDFIVGWKHIGLDIKINATTGWVKVYIDGIEKMSWTGNTGTADVVSFSIGKKYNGNNVTYWDDLYVDDLTGEAVSAQVPIRRFRHVVPNGAGNYTQWTPSAGNNWDCVEEIPPSAAEYVDTTLVDKLDSYAMSTFVLNAGEVIEAVIPIAYAKRDGATEEIALGTRLSGTDLVGSDQAPGAVYAFLSERQPAKPGGGDWEQADIDAMEIVLKSRGSY